MQLSTKAKILIGSTLALGVATAGIATIHAQTTTSNNNKGPFADIVAAISTKFNLNQTDVQNVVNTVLDQKKADKEAKIEANLNTKLASLVADGKLTQAQSDLIKAKAVEVKTFVDGLKGKSPQDRQAAIKTEMDSLKTWAQQNNIPTQYLNLIFRLEGPGFRGHMHGWMKIK